MNFLGSLLMQNPVFIPVGAYNKSGGTYEKIHGYQRQAGHLKP